MLILALSLAAAGPVYLRCTFDGAPALVTADEANSSVSVAIEATGYSTRMGAAFSASEVRFENGDMRYVINRTDLTASRFIKLLGQTEQGQCRIEQPPERAF